MAQPQPSEPPSLDPEISGTPARGRNIRDPNPAKRHQRTRKANPPQTDGTVSDSVVHPLTSTQSARRPKTHDRSANAGSQQLAQHAAVQHPQHNHTNSHQYPQRPVSLGGHMAPSTPSREAAYAGPTFQASPAPSSLPVPKFFSKSVPNVAVPSHLREREESKTKSAEPEESDERQWSPAPDVVNIARNGQKSPLDMFFSADREEKSRSNSNASPEMMGKKAPFVQDFHGSGVDGFGAPRQRPIDITAQKQRPVSSPHVDSVLQASETAKDRDAQTAALKALLFRNINNPEPQSPPASQPSLSSSTPHAYSQHPTPNARDFSHVYHTPSPVQHRASSGPSTPTPSSQQQHENGGHYSLYYGNQRNLSPLFQAASSVKIEANSSRGPSGLRRHELAPEAAQKSYQPSSMDSNAFSRETAERHAREGGVAAPPSFPFNNGPSSSAEPPLTSRFAATPNGIEEGRRSFGSGSQPQTSGAAGASARGARDVKGMEDDLRRMLKMS